MASANGVSTGDGDTIASSSIGKQLPALPMILYSLYFLAILQGFYYAITTAYDIRLYAIKEYGRVIHEFDPYFNYRATEYLWAHGWHAFSHWYDDMVWYPLGRPVGTTIYPGMQVTSVAIKQYLLPDWSINDICCFVPAWFGSIATMGTAWLAYECTQEYTTTRACLGQIAGVDWLYTNFVAPFLGVTMNTLHRVTGSTWGLPHPYIRRPAPAFEAALWTALIMSIVPAHLLRSVAGGYDNESVATTAMVVTFAAWTRTLRETKHEWTTIMWGIITGICYFYMVAAWGGYVFVINLIGVHASLLVLMGRFSGKLHKAYTSFYIVGTFLATRVPVVGMTPLKSLEQLGPFVAFAGIQLLEYCRRQQIKQKLGLVDLWKLRIRVFSMAGVVALILVFFLAPTGYFGPLSSRVRGLFVKHTKTGNPLVDSVAEHQAASPSAYFQYLNDVVYVAPVGFGLVLFAFCNDSSSFLIVYGIAAYFFSHRMVRLILLTAPIASTLGGIALGHLQGWMVGSLFPQTPNAAAMWAAMMGGETEQVLAPPAKTPVKNKAAAKKDKKKADSKASEDDAATPDTIALTTSAATKRDPYLISAIRLAISVYVVTLIKPRLPDFYKMCDQMAQQISHPTIIQKGRTKSGDPVLVDDYRDAYFWLRDNTPEDARIMAWWDYGYQITGIGNRTTIADGNTWNHEHIALLGKTLTSPEKEGHRVARHLADYILVWAGGGGDDLAKSPHLIRIANSVYRGLCGEPTCREFGYYSNGEPSERMAESMLYKLHSHKLKPGVEADPNRFKLVYHSKYGKVRIFKILKVAKESKEWVKANKICDGGGWVCRGQYPPALQKILSQKKDFKQLEDFNVKGEDDSEYQKQYMENLLNQGGARKAEPEKKKKETPARPPKLTDEDIEMFNEAWENNELTSQLWELIAQNRESEFKELLKLNPAAAHVRSEDGRGPMWWAHEYKRAGIIEILRKLKVSEKRTDQNGKTPLDL